MCGRFTLITNIEMIYTRFLIDTGNLDLKTSYNVAPGQIIPTIITVGCQRRIGQLRWGPVPENITNVSVVEMR